jgi:lipid-A-disaccharide synthase
MRTARRDPPVRIVSGDTYGVIGACDLILTSSGTVTLEAAILGTPMVITYRLSRISAEIGIRLLRDRKQFFGLPNVIAGRQVAPEFIHDDARAELIAAEAIELLKNPERLDAQRREFRKIREELGSPGISDRVARLVLETAMGRR